MCRQSFATTSADGRVRVHQSGSAKVISEFQAHDDAVNVLRWWGPLEFLTGSDDCTVKHWDVRNTRHPLSHFQGHQGWVKNCEVVNERLCASASFDGTVRVWDRYERGTHHPPDMLAVPPVALYSANVRPQANIMFFHPELLRIAVHRSGVDDWVIEGRAFVPTEAARASPPPHPPSQAHHTTASKRGRPPSKMAIAVGRSVLLVRSLDVLTAAPALFEAAHLLPAWLPAAQELHATITESDIDATFGAAVDAFIDLHQAPFSALVTEGTGEGGEACGAQVHPPSTIREGGAASPSQDEPTLSRDTQQEPQQNDERVGAVNDFVAAAYEQMEGGAAAVPPRLPQALQQQLARVNIHGVPHLNSDELVNHAPFSQQWHRSLWRAAFQQLWRSARAWSQRLQRQLGVATLQGVMWRMGQCNKQVAHTAEVQYRDYLQSRASLPCERGGQLANTVQRLWSSPDEHAFAMRFDASGQFLVVRSSYTCLQDHSPVDDMCAHFQHSRKVCRIPRGWALAAAPPLNDPHKLVDGEVAYELEGVHPHMPCACLRSDDWRPPPGPREGGCTSVMAVDGELAERVHQSSRDAMLAEYPMESGVPLQLAAWCDVGYDPLAPYSPPAPHTTGEGDSGLYPRPMLVAFGQADTRPLLTASGQLAALLSASAPPLSRDEGGGGPLVAFLLALLTHPARPGIPHSLHAQMGLSAGARSAEGGRGSWLAASLGGEGWLHCTVLRVAHTPTLHSGIITAPCFSAGNPPFLLCPSGPRVQRVNLPAIVAAIRRGGAFPHICIPPSDETVTKQTHTSASHGVLRGLWRRSLGMSGAAPPPPCPAQLHWSPTVHEQAHADEERMQRTVRVIVALARQPVRGLHPSVLLPADLLFVSRHSPQLRFQLPAGEEEQVQWSERVCALLLMGHHELLQALLSGIQMNAVLDITAPPLPHGGVASAVLSAAHMVAVTQYGQVMVLR